MVNSQAQHEAVKRWGAGAFAQLVGLGGSGTDLCVVGKNNTPFGVGKSWEDAFQDADSTKIEFLDETLDPKDKL